MIKPRITSTSIWKYMEALFKGLFSDVRVVEEWGLSLLGAPVDIKGNSRTIRKKRIVLWECQSWSCWNHVKHLLFSVEEYLCDTKAAICIENIIRLCTESSAPKGPHTRSGGIQTAWAEVAWRPPESPTHYRVLPEDRSQSCWDTVEFGYGVYTWKRRTTFTFGFSSGGYAHEKKRREVCGLRIGFWKDGARPIYNYWRSWRNS